MQKVNTSSKKKGEGSTTCDKCCSFYEHKSVVRSLIFSHSVAEGLGPIVCRSCCMQVLLCAGPIVCRSYCVQVLLCADPIVCRSCCVQALSLGKQFLTFRRIIFSSSSGSSSLFLVLFDSEVLDSTILRNVGICLSNDTT